MSAPRELESRVGFEVALLTPRGRSRADLAAAIAAAGHGVVRPVFHRDSEPSAVPGMGSFHHLSRGFAVVDADATEVCRVVDDVTIVADLDGRAAPLPGWHRVLTDDRRLLNLLAATCDPGAGVGGVLAPVAELLGTGVTRVGGGLYRVADGDGATVAMAAPLPGERHRPAEIVTPPLERDHAAALERVLAPARALGCTVPVEAAVHLHFDAAPFRTPRAFANVIELFSAWRAGLWHLFGTNTACCRLAPLPSALVDLAPALRGLLGWAGVAEAVAGIELSRFCDVDLRHVVAAPPVRDTLEVRILPGADRTEDIVGRAAVVEALLYRCWADPALPEPTGRAAADAAALLDWAKGA